MGGGHGPGGGGMKEGDDGEGFLLQGEREVTPSVKLSAQSINQAD